MTKSAETSTTSAAIAVCSSSPDDLLSTQQLAMDFGLSFRTLENWRQNGGGPPYIRCGGRLVRYRRRDAADWLTARRYSSTSSESHA